MVEKDVMEAVERVRRHFAHIPDVAALLASHDAMAAKLHLLEAERDNAASYRDRYKRQCQEAAIAAETLSAKLSALEGSARRLLFDGAGSPDHMTACERTMGATHPCTCGADALRAAFQPTAPAEGEVPINKRSTDEWMRYRRGQLRSKFAAAPAQEDRDARRKCPACGSINPRLQPALSPWCKDPFHLLADEEKRS